jgi:hypothetical protein
MEFRSDRREGVWAALLIGMLPQSPPRPEEKEQDEHSSRLIAWRDGTPGARFPRHRGRPPGGTTRASHGSLRDRRQERWRIRRWKRRTHQTPHKLPDCKYVAELDALLAVATLTVPLAFHLWPQTPFLGELAFFFSSILRDQPTTCWTRTTTSINSPTLALRRPLSLRTARPWSRSSTVPQRSW